MDNLTKVLKKREVIKQVMDGLELLLATPLLHTFFTEQHCSVPPPLPQIPKRVRRSIMAGVLGRSRRARNRRSVHFHTRASLQPFGAGEHPPKPALPPLTSRMRRQSFKDTPTNDVNDEEESLSDDDDETFDSDDEDAKPPLPPPTPQFRNGVVATSEIDEVLPPTSSEPDGSANEHVVVPGASSPLVTGGPKMLTSFGSVNSCAAEASDVFEAIDAIDPANRSNYFHEEERRFETIIRDAMSADRKVASCVSKIAMSVREQAAAHQRIQQFRLEAAAEQAVKVSSSVAAEVPHFRQ
eukprot:INCI13048.1.p1 GENE.INCI13048.1~~INCI13048.1.p1  ORF type:complete len:344 (-),score=103.63 INCI13048.1:37-927(-)